MNTEVNKTCSSCDRVFITSADLLRSTSRWRICSKQYLWFECGCGATLFIKEGKYPWYSPKDHMTSEAASIFDQLAKKDHLPFIKSTILELQQMLKQPNVDLGQFTKHLRKSPVLSANVMEIANQMRTVEIDKSRISATKNSDQILSAVVYLGQTSLEGVLMLAFVKTIEIQTQVFSSDLFWEKSQLSAILSEFMVGQLAPCLNNEDAYACGFLANIGKIVAAFYYPEQVDQIQSQLNDPKCKLTWLEVETAEGFYDHRVLGEIAAAFWGLPRSALNAIQGHHSVSQNQKKNPIMSDIVALSTQVAHWISLEPHQIDDELLANLLDKFSLDQTKLEELLRNFERIRNPVGAAS